MFIKAQIMLVANSRKSEVIILVSLGAIYCWITSADNVPGFRADVKKGFCFFILIFPFY